MYVALLALAVVVLFAVVSESAMLQAALSARERGANAGGDELDLLFHVLLALFVIVGLLAHRTRRRRRA